MVKLLLKHGAKRDLKTASGATALDMAKRKGDPDIIALLQAAD